MSDYLSIQDASKLLGVSESMLQRRCKEGSLRAARVGRQFRIDRSALETWLRFEPEPSSVKANKLAVPRIARQGEFPIGALTVGMHHSG